MGGFIAQQGPEVWGQGPDLTRAVIQQYVGGNVGLAPQNVYRRASWMTRLAVSLREAPTKFSGL